MENVKFENENIFRNGAGIKQIFIGNKLIYSRKSSYIYINLENNQRQEKE